jgi:hypothetical protein
MRELLEPLSHICWVGYNAVRSYLTITSDISDHNPVYNVMFAILYIDQMQYYLWRELDTQVSTTFPELRINSNQPIKQLIP